jgi:hypothetical protein
MKNVAIIILGSFKIRKFDLERFEVNHLKNFSYLEIHEFSKLLYPYFINSHKSHFIKNKNIISFLSLNLWKKQILFLKNKYKKILIINCLVNSSFLVLKIYSFLKENQIKRVDLQVSGLPYYSTNKKISSSDRNYFYKLKNLFLRPNYLIQKSKVLIKNFIINFFINNFDHFKSEFILKAGKKYLNSNNNQFTKVISGASLDYSRYLRRIKIKKIRNLNNYAVFLAAPGPDNPNDALLWKTKMADTVADYYNSLNNFFLDIERIYKTKIVIALHPKSPRNKRLKKFGGRFGYYNKTLELVKNSKFIINFASSGISYALLFKKPIFFIYTEAQKNKNPETVKLAKFLHSLVGGKLINIDAYSEKDLKTISHINNKKYQEYIKNYMCFNNRNKTNYQIIYDLIKKSNV